MYVLVVAISGGDVVATSVVAKSAPSNREGWVGMDLISLKWKIMFMNCNPSENRGFLLGNGCKNVIRRKVSQTSVMSLM